MRHLIQCVAFVVLILACLSGCRKTEQDMQVMNTEVNEISVPSDASVVETEPYLTTVPNEVKTQHLFQEVDEYVRVDAEVTLPEKDAYSTYTLKMVDCDPDRLFSIMNGTTKFSLRNQASRLTVTTDELQSLLGCGRKSAVDIGEMAEARIQLGKRVLWNVEKVRIYLNLISA